MASSLSLPSTVTEASVSYETSYGSVDLSGVFLWVAVLVVARVVLF